MPRAGEGCCMLPRAADSPQNWAVMGLCPQEGLLRENLSAPGQAFADPACRPCGFGGAFIGTGSSLCLLNKNVQASFLSKVERINPTALCKPFRLQS